MQPPRWFHAPNRPTQRLSGSLPAAAAADYATQDGMVRSRHLHERLRYPHVTSQGHACIGSVASDCVARMWRTTRSWRSTLDT